MEENGSCFDYRMFAHSQVDSKQIYRLMTYFAHSTLIMYSKTIICEENMTIDDFRNVNEKVVERIFDEAKSIFNYELSYEQMNTAINVYFITKFKPLSVFETEVFKPKN